MTESRLKLNADKTEFLIIGTHRQRDKIKTLVPIPLLNQHVMPAVSTRNLGVISNIYIKRPEECTDNNNTLSKCQYGFRSSMFTSHVLLDLVEEIRKSLDKNTYLGFVSL